MSLHYKNPIGVFDSGVGGVSILKELEKQLPFEDFIYLSDAKNLPYGNKSIKQIQDFCISNTEFLLQKKCKIIVVACNTATTNAISLLRKKYPKTLFIGVEPALKPAAEASKIGHVGVLATAGTLKSTSFKSLKNRFGQHIKLTNVAGKGLVEWVEKGDFKHPDLLQLLQKYVYQLTEDPIDQLVLGCTHYPFLKQILIELLPNHVQVIDSGKAVARQTRSILEKNQLLKTSYQNSDKNSLGKYSFYATANPSVLAHFTKLFFSSEPVIVVKI